jgi:hypothetical protein
LIKLARGALLDVQEGRAEDAFGWMAPVPSDYQQLTDWKPQA